MICECCKNDVDELQGCFIEDGADGIKKLFMLCLQCHADAEKLASYKNAEVNPMAKKFTVVVSLPKGVTETNFADNVGVIREAKRKDGSLITMKKSGGSVYRFPLNVTKLSAMIKKHNLKKIDKYGQEVVWLSVFEKSADAKAGGSDL